MEFICSMIHSLAELSSKPGIRWTGWVVLGRSDWQQSFLTVNTLIFSKTCFWQIIAMVSMDQYDLHLGRVYLYVQYVSFHIIWLSVHSSMNGIVGTWMFLNDFESRNVTCWILKIMKKPTRSFLPMSRFYLSFYQSLF